MSKTRDHASAHALGERMSAAKAGPCDCPRCEAPFWAPFAARNNLSEICRAPIARQFLAAVMPAGGEVLA